MSKIVTNYLISPRSTKEDLPQLQKTHCHAHTWIGASLGQSDHQLNILTDTPAVPTLRSSRYQLQGMLLPLASSHRADVNGPFTQPVKLVVFFVAGSNAHLLSCRQRSVECAYAARCALQSRDSQAGVVLVRFNPFGVVNDQVTGLPLPYSPSALTQNDLTQDYVDCARLILQRYSGAQMIVMGHSLGGVFARQVFSCLRADDEYASRLRFVYSAMSLPGIADAFMYYQPATMLKNLIPDRCRTFVNWCINSINYIGFNCIQRALKHAVERSGWKTVVEQINIRLIAQSNLVKKNIDRMIPDAVASVQREGALNWLLNSEHSTDAHDLPPSELYHSSAQDNISELEKLIELLKRVFSIDHNAVPPIHGHSDQLSQPSEAS
jgi:hypothetical protein